MASESIGFEFNGLLCLGVLREQSLHYTVQGLRVPQNGSSGRTEQNSPEHVASHGMRNA